MGCMCCPEPSTPSIPARTRSSWSKSCALASCSVRFTSAMSVTRHPFVDFPVRLFLGLAVAFLDDALELFAIARRHVDIVVGQAAPVLQGVALELLPLTLDLVPVHEWSPFVASHGRRAESAHR